ncbi:Structural maintenance of chromosomes protein 3 [Echinococcus granulosus]|uniref:Structural maintenance of chromosomes protein n=1 Tax=Echinococcus granulosus TaxID=6210 RepID=A0A068WHE8_ECHGR|nr:Structural maintenance of chromosomes protein 3 [Echinococcus granulosus]CDS17851.1 structural maintenance of chromosomes protein 3 [Echinococcus granulosus]
MYIKRVIIQGFRSYRDQTCPEDFSPHHNIVVGRNGSGKSNFFQAIQFVLSDEYSHLSNQERQNFLHEGTGPRVISAYVEIIFDNSDGRIPSEKHEVSLRRIIGSKKDQFFLDKKIVTKTEVMNMFESAGFSRSNPYYIVKQGKITQLATAPDSQRLKLLREVAGTRVYDERKAESKLIFRESEAKREQISKLLESIEERLGTLENETKELKEYQRWDRDRRALEYTIYDRELKETRRKLEELQSRREQSSESTAEIRRAAKDTAAQIERLERELRDTRLKEAQLQDEAEQVQHSVSAILQRREQLQLTCGDYTNTLRSGKSARERAAEELNRVNAQIEVVEQRLAELKPEYKAARQKEDDLANALSDAEHRRKELFAKQGRVNQFRSRVQRDEWIKNQMKSQAKAIKDKENTIAKLTEEIKKDDERRAQLEKDLEGAEENLNTVRTELDAVSEDSRRLRREKEETQADRQTVYREETRIAQELNNWRDELARTEHSLRSITGKVILNGLDSVRKVIEIFRDRFGPECEIVQGYYGTLIELLECPEDFYTCVEVTAGARLFYHVVQSDRYVIKIINEINKHNLPGEVHFLPINKLYVKESHYPEVEGAIPMISRLKFDDKFRPVMVHIFGKTLICSSLEVATQLARRQNFDCITLDGDQASRKGTLTGGYYDNRMSRLELQRRKQKTEMEIQETENVRENNAKRKEQVDAQINRIIDEAQRKETVQSKLEMTFDKLKKDIHLWKEELRAKTEARPQKEWKLSSLRHDLDQMKYTMESYKAELGTELPSQLSVQEQREVDRLNDKIQALTREAKEAYRQRMNLETEKTEKETQLEHNLFRKREQLEAELAEVSEQDLAERLREAQEELKEADNRIEAEERTVDEVESRLAALMQDQRRLEAELEAKRMEEKDYAERIQDDQQSLEKMQSKQSQLFKKKEENMKKIRDLGSLPADAFDKFQDKSLKQLFKLLDKANRELKRYSHVNKKALDQFVSHSEEKEKLLKRKEELDEAHQAIIDLMNALDHQKYEAITLTFKQVSKNFQDIFKRLVPEGRAELVMHRGKKPAEGDEEGSDEGGGTSPAAGVPVPEVELFTGVGIRVSFTGETADMRDMNQLSGGQKSLVALTLIFAIQKCDPAPFYLFDEIDAALDAQYRAAVADMIRDLKSDAQFITTTFRPELLESAEKYYGVKFRNKVSHIECVTKEEALDFVEDDQTHG